MKRNRLLVLKKLLEQETSAHHPLTSSEILQKLNAEGFPIDRKTLYRDLAALKDSQIAIKKKGHSYYIAENLFNYAELRIMSDAIRAAHFLSSSNRNSLLNKIASLTNRHDASSLSIGTYSENRTRKSKQKANVYSNIQHLQNALERKCMIQFYYGFSKNKRKVELSPQALFWKQDRYFLLGFHHESQNLHSYLIEQISDIILSKKQAKSINLESKTPSASEKFSSPDYRETISLRCANHLLGTFFEYFDLKTNAITQQEKHFIFTGQTLIDEKLVAWLMQFGSKIEVLYPQKLQKMLFKTALQTAQLYRHVAQS